MFLKYILSRDKEELVSKILWAQVKSPEKNDWCSTVTNDLNDLDMHYSFEDISAIGENTLKELVKQKVTEKALEYLNGIKQNQSKMNNIVYKELKMQEYLVNNKTSIKQKKLLFSLRTKMVRVYRNYGSQQLCPLGCGLADTQENLLQCSVIKMNCFAVLINQEVKHCDIYGTDGDKMTNAVKLFDKAITTRKLLLEKEK